MATLKNNFSEAKKNNGIGKNVSGRKNAGPSAKLTASIKKQSLKVGNTYTVKITALGANNVGINEFSYNCPVLVPNAKLGDNVQVKIVKMHILKGIIVKKYAIAKLIKVVNNANLDVPVNVGQTMDVTITQLGPKATGIVELNSNFKLIVKLNKNVALGDKINVKVTRLKASYGFAIISSEAKVVNNATSESTFQSSSLVSDFSLNGLKLTKGSKFNVILPKKAKRYLKHLVLKINTIKTPLKNGEDGFFSDFSLNAKHLKENYGTAAKKTILFIKPQNKSGVLGLGAQLGNKIKLQITKIVNSTKYNFSIAIAKVIGLNPMSEQKKKLLVRASVQQMLKSGMHYGEKAIKCHARMKNYVWIRRKGVGRDISPNNFSGYSPMVNSQAAKNKPLIKKGRNVINLLKTRRCLNKALVQLSKYSAKGKTFLFVGTKKAAAGLVARASLFSKKAFFVNTRWLGGMLTNWKTILKSISKIRPILKEKQIIIKNILEKRQNIKQRLMEKAFLLRKKSKIVLKKGRNLLQLLKAQGLTSNSKMLFAEKTTLLLTKRKELIAACQLLLEKRQHLLEKRKQLILNSQSLKLKASEVATNYKNMLTKLTITRKKLRELKSLLFVSQELQQLKQNAKQQNKDLYMVSYNQFKQLNNNTFGDFSAESSLIPNPPKEILNKMVSIIKGQSLNTGANSSTKAGVSSNAYNQKDTNSSNSSSNSTTQVLILSKLLSKFSSFVPTIKASIATFQKEVKQIESNLLTAKNLLNTIKLKINMYLSFKTNLVGQLRQIKQTLLAERNVIRLLKRKLKQISAQKRLIKFLPKLRYLPTPSTNISQTVQVLMKKIVDPKMKYPMDSIYDEKLTSQSKKVAASRKKKWQRLEKYLGGISNMTKITENQVPAASQLVAIIIGQQEEMNAVRECQKLGIKMFHVVDTNCNPGFADHFIPANDDSRNSIKFILTKFLSRIRLAQKIKIRLKK